jgi:cell division protein FtsZ
VTLKGAKSLLLSITGGRDLTLWEVDEAANRVRQEVDPDANIIVGATFDESLGDKVRVSIVASGMARAHGRADMGARAPQRMHVHPGRGAPQAAPTPPQGDFHRRLSDAIGEAGVRSGSADQLANEPAGWHAPGDVYIQERAGPSPLSPFPPTTHGANQAIPADGSRGPRPAPAYQRQPESRPAKVGLFRRLTGAGRSGREDAQAARRPVARGAAGESDEQVDLPVFFRRNKR